MSRVINERAFVERYGPWAVVAGASEGLGEAFARELASRGLKLVLIARRQDKLQALADTLTVEGVECRVCAMDLASPTLAQDLGVAVAELEIGMVVYNAAYAPVGAFMERSVDELMRVVDVNVRGPLVLARTLLEPMIERRRGGMVLMASLAGLQGTPRLAAYAASKAFNVVFAESLWGELQALNDCEVDVVTCVAGAIRTPGYEQARGGEAPGTLDASVVAADALAQLGRGPRSVPGAINKFASLLLGRWLPRKRAVAIMAANTRDLS